MALWTIRRIASQADAVASLDCGADEVATVVTLRDLTTGLDENLTLCMNIANPDPCHLMAALRGAGYTPADWDTECPP